MNQLEKADNIYGLGEKIDGEEGNYCVELKDEKNSEHDSLIDAFEFINNFKKLNKKSKNTDYNTIKKFDEKEHLDIDTLLALNKL